MSRCCVGDTNPPALSPSARRLPPPPIRFADGGYQPAFAVGARGSRNPGARWHFHARCEGSSLPVDGFDNYLWQRLSACGLACVDGPS